MIAEQFVAGLLIAVSLKKEKESLEMSSFVEDQWNQFCSNLEQTAKFLAGDDQQLLDKFLKISKRISRFKIARIVRRTITIYRRGNGTRG